MSYRVQEKGGGGRIKRTVKSQQKSALATKLYSATNMLVFMVCLKSFWLLMVVTLFTVQKPLALIFTFLS